MKNPILTYLRRNKRKCSHCGSWTDLDFTGNWCRQCIRSQSKEVLRAIGSLVGLRVLERNAQYVDDLIEHVDAMIRVMPDIEGGNKLDLQRTLAAVVRCRECKNIDPDNKKDQLC